MEVSNQQVTRFLSLHIKKATVSIAAILLAACGGGGGGGNTTVPPVTVDPSSGWVAGQYEDWRSNSMRNICSNPRTTGGYSDTQGSVTDENFWIRSYSNDTYLWYSELPDIDPGTVDSTEDYYNLMVTDGLSPRVTQKISSITVKILRSTTNTTLGYPQAMGCVFLLWLAAHRERLLLATMNLIRLLQKVACHVAPRLFQSMERRSKIVTR